MKFKAIELINACGYRRASFDLNPGLNMLYGPNGCGKSNLLYIANILASPTRHQGRDVSMLFRKMIFSSDYNPGYQAFADLGEPMIVQGIFADETDNEYCVRLEMDPSKMQELEELAKYPDKGDEYQALIEEVGIVENDLPESKNEYAFLSNADNPSNMGKFQLEGSVANVFLDIAKAVYGYECYLDKEVEEYDSQTRKNVTFFTDFVLIKDDDGEGFEPVHVHYRRMSDGERKIATLLKQLCSPLHRKAHDIYLVDNIEMHVYMARHTLLVDKLQEHFPEKQFIATSHSPLLVGLKGVIDPYLSPEHLHEVIEIRRACSLAHVNKQKSGKKLGYAASNEQKKNQALKQIISGRRF
jgi:predicted ATPase